MKVTINVAKKSSGFFFTKKTYEVPVHFMKDDPKFHMVNNELEILFNKYGSLDKRSQMIEKSLKSYSGGASYIASFNINKKLEDPFLCEVKDYYRNALNAGCDFARSSNYIQEKYHGTGMVLPLVIDKIKSK